MGENSILVVLRIMASDYAFCSFSLGPTSRATRPSRISGGTRHELLTIGLYHYQRPKSHGFVSSVSGFAPACRLAREHAARVRGLRSASHQAEMSQPTARGTIVSIEINASV